MSGAYYLLILAPFKEKNRHIWVGRASKDYAV